MSTSIFRFAKNIYRSGWRRAGWQLQVHNDVKSGTLIGTDDHGNKYYETDAPEEPLLRTRWVEYNNWSPDISQVEPGWHYWLGYGSNTPPNKLEGSEKTTRAYPLPAHHKPNLTNTPGAYVCYNTAKPKCQSWSPEVKERAGERVGERV